MELRVLRYFLAVARAESITGAAQTLRITQPTLSRQIADMEQELGVRLLNRRKNSKVTLTEAGVFLRRHAEEIVALADKTAAAFSASGEVVAGDVHICAGETDAVRLLARAARNLRERYPNIRYHISSGDRSNVEDELDKGLSDFGILLGPANFAKYDYLTLPIWDTWGVLMRDDAPLTEKERIRPEDLWDKPLILSRQSSSNEQFLKWIGKPTTELNIAATYSLVYNASLLALEGMGYVLALDRLINVSGDSDLCFRPLENVEDVPVHLVWKKHQEFSTAATLFLNELRTESDA